MKEIIYLDTEIINSMLAQLDEGIVNSFTLESSSQETQGEESQSTLGKSAGINARIKLSTGFFPGGSATFGGNSGNNGIESEKISTTMLEGQKDILNKAFHDHALEILHNKLLERNLLKDIQSAVEGDVLFLESSFRFYDFELLKNSIDVDVMKQTMTFDETGTLPSYEEAKNAIKKNNNKNTKVYQDAQTVLNIHNSIQPIMNVMSLLHSLGKYASQMLQNQSIIKAGTNIGIIKHKYLRESPEALVFRTDTSRKAKILLRVIGKKNQVFDGKNMKQLKEQDMDKIPNMMLDVILGSFQIINKGDLLVTPIAIYFE
ncbi:DUF6414 family protein [Lysinibacillus fusiformis]|uniref:DUF6414 family protein n=1 Tax=Lysinibacillus fusiformis TaxID=28031 RepID=UPI003D01E537